ncbi:UDP-N-acetylenolpyruvoylglucosamine reductase [Spirochaetia bacterium]|nr:UDP-N-acetylenolpyruvoylglucosamine reductase [Spirochaetia bacterium]
MRMDYVKYAFYNEPLSKHTTFKVGGNAEIMVRPPANDFAETAKQVMIYAKENDKRVFVLGGGSNVVFCDAGFKGIVLDTSLNTAEPLIVECKRQTGENESFKEMTFLSGTLSDDASKAACKNSSGGLEFLSSLPGTIGGAVRMNARCFDQSISDKISRVEILDKNLQRVIVPYNASDWDYKKSPFQKDNIIILSATFKLKNGTQKVIAQKMESYNIEREKRGHFLLPSAGSVFKNNREHGKPAGQIIDELGLRGKEIGGARIAPWHGNFIVNHNNAKASDIAALVKLAQSTAYEKLGILLEREIIFVDFD